MAGRYVVANRDFTYTDDLRVRRGQVFRLGEHRNDEVLIKHGHVTVMEPQPKASAVDRLPTCGLCGRQFTDENWRDRCGRMDENPADVVADRRRRAAGTASRVISVGA